MVRCRLRVSGIPAETPDEKPVFAVVVWSGHPRHDPPPLAPPRPPATPPPGGGARPLSGPRPATVPPSPGRPANLAVYFAVCRPGDPIMGQNLPDGGHLTHGWNVSISGTYFKSVPYHVQAAGDIDLDEGWRLARGGRA